MEKFYCANNQKEYEIILWPSTATIKEEASEDIILFSLHPDGKHSFTGDLPDLSRFIRYNQNNVIINVNDNTPYPLYFYHEKIPNCGNIAIIDDYKINEYFFENHKPNLNIIKQRNNDNIDHTYFTDKYNNK